MSTIRKLPDGPALPLLAFHRLGRARGSDLRLANERASGDHAHLTFVDGRWFVRDLGSRNGTWLDGKLLEAGVDHPLAEGARLAFGDPREEWVLETATAPTAVARSLFDGHLQLAVDGRIQLAEDLSVVELAEWTVDDAGARRPAVDGEILRRGDQAWRLWLPEGVTRTVGRTIPELASIKLRFAVSLDEEHVRIWLQMAGRTRLLDGRSHHYMLLTLARIRDADLTSHPSEQGWVDIVDLAKMLRSDRKTLDVYVGRLRGQFHALRIPDADDIVERRLGSGQLRIGPVTWEIGPLE